MRLLALLVGLLIVVIALVLAVAPDRVMTTAPYVITPMGLVAMGALRIGMGLVLMLVAPTSRAPRTLRVIGAVVVVAGLMTPLVGVDRMRGIADWGAAQGPALLRGIAAVMLAIGGFIVFAVAARRRRAS